MKKITLVSLLLACLTLTSCRYIDFTSSSNSETSNSGASASHSGRTSTSAKPSGIVDSTYENYVKNSVYYESAIPTSTPTSKYLVLPVWFKDSSSLIKTGETKESILANVTTAFSGTEEETGWHSVKTYYAAESDGKKNFDFVIADWYDCNYNSSYVAGDQNDYTIANYTEKIINLAIDNYFEKSGADRKDFDSDGDGYLDAVATIYAIQNYNSGFDFEYYYYGGNNFGPRRGEVHSFSNLWAYVYWMQDPSQQNVNYPGPNAYLWASYDFANVSSKNARGYPIKSDAHAYIHETGHLFGLDDYYDYTVTNNKPGGGFSMQDNNVGGHDPFSILSLGWGEVIAPTETQTITLKPFQDSKQVILLSEEYKDSIFDEYLLLELYTPTGLNQLDTEYCYQGTYPQGPNAAGIRLWHVDARLAYKYARGTDVPYSTSQITNKIDTQYYYNMLCRNNTYDPSKEDDYFSPLKDFEGNYKYYRLLELIRCDDTARFYSREKENLAERDLFKAGDSFDMDTYTYRFVERGKLNSGKTLGWSFTVDALSSESATITVTKL